jgi:hypothetical protein
MVRVVVSVYGPFLSQLLHHNQYFDYGQLGCSSDDH